MYGTKVSTCIIHVHRHATHCTVKCQLSLITTDDTNEMTLERKTQKHEALYKRKVFKFRLFSSFPTFHVLHLAQTALKKWP